MNRSPIHSHDVGPTSLQFTSLFPPVSLWKRRGGAVAAEPLLPPSPVSGRYQRGDPVKDSVPLSCVPVIAVSSGEYGLTEMVFICSVPRPALMTFSSPGIWPSHAGKSARA